MDDIILRVKDICKYYPGVKALDGVNFEVKRGEVHAICGENGAGKSTFIKILTGANEPTSGTIEFNGKEYAKLTPKQSMEIGISVIYQEFSLDSISFRSRKYLLWKRNQEGYYQRHCSHGKTGQRALQGNGCRH